MKTLWISAGHSLAEEGSIVNELHENKETIKIRDELKKILTGYDAVYIADNLTLKETIEEIHLDAISDDFAIDIHLNNNSDPTIRGTEGYYSVNPRYAGIFSRCVAKSLGIPDRGAKSDNQTAVGSLGFLRKLPCPSVLIECCYLSNKSDVAAYSPYRCAQGIKNAIDELFGQERIIQLKWTLSSLIKQIIQFLSRKLNRLTYVNIQKK